MINVSERAFADSTENSLIRALQNGEEAAFRGIYSLHCRALYFFCNAIVKNDQEAQDIVTESFVKLFDNISKVDSLKAIKGFLYTTARKMCLVFLRNNRNRNEHHDHILQSQNTAEDPILVYIVKAEHRNALYQAIALLPPKRRQIILELVQNGKTVRELALELNMSEKSIYSARERALRFLKNTLENQINCIIIFSLYILLNIKELIKKF